MNNNNDNAPIIFISVLTSIVFFVMGYVISARDTGDIYQKEAIKRNFAEYNAQTGKWQWKETINNSK